MTPAVGSCHPIMLSHPTSRLLCPPPLQLFAQYDVDTNESFGVLLAQLVDTLNVFTSSSDERLEMRYPGPNGELQLE